MDNYNLQPNEVIVFKGNCQLSKTDEKILNSMIDNSSIDLILTNLNLVFINKSKKMFSKEKIDVEIYPTSEIKIYNDAPQINQKNNIVEIFFSDSEKSIVFTTSHEARKFVGKALELLTGKNLSNRVSDKIKGSINLVDDTLGIKTVDTVKNVVENGVVGSIFGSLGKKVSPKSNKTANVLEIVNAAKDVISQPSKSQVESKEKDASLDEQIKMIKKFKELLDAGVITQEEFENKKKQLLNL